MKSLRDHCPVTGLPITQRPEWTEIGFGGDYRITLSLLGDHILLSKVSGQATEEDMKQSLPLNKAIQDRCFPGNRPFIRIEDWTELKGVSRKARELYIAFMKDTKRIDTAIIFGMKTAIKVAVKITRRFNLFPFQIEIVNDYISAVKKACDIWSDHRDVFGEPLKGSQSSSLPVQGNHKGSAQAFADPSWQFQTDNFSLHYEVIDGNILHGNTRGLLEEGLIAPSFQTMEKTVRFIQNFSNHYYYVLGINSIQGITQKARKSYVTSIIQFYKEFPFEMLVFYGANALLRAAVNLSAPFVPFKTRLAKDLNEALDIIKRDKFEHQNQTLPAEVNSRSKKPSRDDQTTRKYVNDILQYLEMINWGEAEEKDSQRVDPAHPFLRVFEALDLIKWEYNDMLQERKNNEEILMRSKEEAERANRAKSEFLSNMSHELRTPLNHIIGFSELLADRHFGELNPVQEDYLNDILHSSRHLLSLINDILDLSKVEAGKMKLEVTNVTLRPLLEQSLVMVKEKALKHGINLKMSLGDIPETLRADERKIKQILYNLLSNAVKFTPDGGSVLLASNRVEPNELPPETYTPNLETDTEWIEISISDTGIGLKEKDLTRIFEPFEQVDGTTSRKHQGTGLGLSLTRELVKMHGGCLWAVSNGEGQGASFHFTLPIPDKREEPEKW